MKLFIKKRFPIIAQIYRTARGYIKSTSVYRFIHIIKLCIDNKVLILRSPTKYELEAITALKQEIKSLPQLDFNVHDSAELFWLKERAKLRAEIQNKDPRSFLTWKMLRETIFGDGAGWKEEWQALDERLKRAACETSVGLPVRYSIDKRTSAPMVRHGYHLKQFEQKTDIPIESMDLIVEFGGGYGGMCRLIHNLGFKGKYIIYDYPELNALQRYFLTMHNIKTIRPIDSSSNMSGVELISDNSILRNTLGFKGGNSLLIATWSISETSQAVRNEFLSLPAIQEVRNFLITYQENFFEKNNHQFFNEVIEGFKKNKWQKNEINHFPKNYYLIGCEDRN